MDDDPLLDGEVEAEGVGDADDDGDWEADGDTDSDTELLGEIEIEVDADGDGLTEGEPSSISSGASTTANATRTTLSVCHAISTSSLDSTTRRRNDSQRRFVKVGTEESSVSTSFAPLGATDSIRRNWTVLSK